MANYQKDGDNSSITSWRWPRVTVIAALMMLALTLNGTSASQIARAAPLLQAQDLCSLFPPGAEPGSAPDATFCSASYSNGTIAAYIRLFNSPDEAKRMMNLERGDQGTPTDIGDAGFRVAAGSPTRYIEYAVRGCYYINTTTYDQAQVNAARDILRQLDGKIVTLPPCSGAPPTAPPPAAAPLGVGHGCSYDEPGISPGQLRCAATYTNALPNANIEYAWKLDGVPQTERGSTFTRNEQDITPGTHTLIVVAQDTKNGKSASSSFTFAKPGGAMIATVLCAAREEDTSAVACYADAQDAPDGAALTYEWTWNGAPEAESGRTLNKTGLKDGSYTITVRARDSAGGKTSSLASTTVTVGVPSQPPANPPEQPPKPPELGPKPPAQPPGQGCDPGIDPYVEVVSMDGDVSAKTGTVGDWKECSANQKLGANVELHTGPESTVTLRYPDGHTLVVKELTQLMIGTLLSKKDRFKIELLLHLGEVKANVQHRETVRSDFSIKTPTATIGVKGTVFSVRHDEKTGTTWTSVEEGEVLVTPVNTALSPVALSVGKQVRVTNDSVSGPAPVASGGPDALSLSTLAPLALVGVVGLIAVLGLLTIARRRTPAARTAMPQYSPGVPARGAPSARWACRRCGTSNRVEGRFCQRCGAPRA